MPRHTADVPPPSYACGCDRDKERENLPLCIARVRSVPLTLSLLRWNSPSPFRPALFHRFPVLPLRPCLGLDSRGRRRGHFISQPPLDTSNFIQVPYQTLSWQVRCICHLATVPLHAPSPPQTRPDHARLSGTHVHTHPPAHSRTRAPLLPCECVYTSREGPGRVGRYMVPWILRPDVYMLRMVCDVSTDGVCVCVCLCWCSPARQPMYLTINACFVVPVPHTELISRGSWLYERAPTRAF